MGDVTDIREGEPESRGLRVMIAVPTHDQVPAMFAYDLGRMMGFLGASCVGPERPIEAMSLTFCPGTYIHSARQELAEHALQEGADYVLWIDSDMRFPKDALIRLLQRREDIVGINYSNRGVPPDFVAIKEVSPPQPCVTGPDSEGLEEVEAVGFGMVLMRTNVLRMLDPPERLGHPWFWHDWLPDLDQQVGEDVFFCRLAREAGFSVYIDHDLSRDCAHIGQLEYTVEHALDFASEERD